MINTGDKVIIYRNGHIDNIGEAGEVVANDYIKIHYYKSDSFVSYFFCVYRCNGHVIFTDRYLNFTTIKIVTEDVWKSTAEKHGIYCYISFFKRDMEKLEEVRRLNIFAREAEMWYATLPEEQRNMIDAIVWNRQGVAVG
jgi:hypothetical protein